MSIRAPQGTLNIPNAILRVGKLELDDASGFDTALNTIARNTILLEDLGPYESVNKQWGLKVPNIFVATFEIQGVSAFNFMNTVNGDANTGYTLEFSGTTLTLKYDDVNLTTATIPDLDSTYGKVYLTYEKQYFTVTIDGTRVLEYKDTITRTPPTNGEYVNFFDTSGAFKNLKIVNGNWITDGTSNISYVGGNVSLSEGLDVSGNVEVGTANLFVDTTTGKVTMNETKISSNLEVGTANLFVDTLTGRVGIGKTDPGAALDVVGEAKVSSNLEVGTSNLFVDTTTGKVTMNETKISSNLEVGTSNLFVDTTTGKVTMNETKISSNLEVGTANLFVDTTTGKVTMNETKISSNLEVGTSNLFVDTQTGRVGIGKTDPGSALDVVGDVEISSNLVVNTDDLFVDTVRGRVGIGTTNPTTKFTIYGTDTEDAGGLLMKVVDDVNLYNGFTGIGLGGYTTDNTQVAKSAIIHERNAFYGRGNLMFCNSNSADTTDVSNTHARMTITSTGNVGIGTTDPSLGTLQLKAEPPSADTTYAGMRIDYNSDGTETLTAIRAHRALYVNSNGSASGGDVTNQHRLFGIVSDTRCQGDTRIMHGLDSYTRTAHSTGEVATVRGTYSLALVGSEGGTVGSVFGGDFRSYKLDSGVTNNMYGVYGECNIQGGTPTYVFGVKSNINRSGGTPTTGYLFYGSYSGTPPTTSYGIYCSGAARNYLGGRLGINTSNPQQALEVHGNILLGENNIASFIHGGNEMAVTSDSSVLIVSDVNDTSGAGTAGADIIFGYGGSVNIDSARDATFGELLPGSKPRVEAMRIRGNNARVGINQSSPAKKLEIKQSSNSQSLPGDALRITNTANDYWDIGLDADSSKSEFYFRQKSGLRSSLSGDRATTADITMNFTGQHRTFVLDVPFNEAVNKEGLIVSADTNEYIRMSQGIDHGSNAITINESLPVVSLSKISNDKKCFGVISASEDPERRVVRFGAFSTHIDKEPGDTRIYVNSLGEGAIWVTNINGSLESGDYITTSNIPGYGQKQDSDFLANYTVAKITMDCDFNPVTKPIKTIKKELRNVTYWVRRERDEVDFDMYSTLDEDRRTTEVRTVYVRTDVSSKITSKKYNRLSPDEQSLYTAIDETVYIRIEQQESTREETEEGWNPEVREEMANVLNEHGEIQWEDDPSGVTEKAYKIRYLDADGNITDEANHVYKAAFVGCTYHCG
jgi:hypothetical protein